MFWRREEESLHVGVGHPALKEVLEAGHAFKSSTSDVQHKSRSSRETAREEREKGEDDKGRGEESGRTRQAVEWAVDRGTAGWSVAGPLDSGLGRWGLL